MCKNSCQWVLVHREGATQRRSLHKGYIEGPRQPHCDRSVTLAIEHVLRDLKARMPGSLRSLLVGLIFKGFMSFTYSFVIIPATSVIITTSHIVTAQRFRLSKESPVETMMTAQSLYSVLP